MRGCFSLERGRYMQDVWSAAASQLAGLFGPLSALCCLLWTTAPVIVPWLSPTHSLFSKHFCQREKHKLPNTMMAQTAGFFSPSWRIRWHYNLKWSKSVTFFSLNQIKAQVSGRKFMSPPHVHPINPNIRWQWKTQSQVLFSSKETHQKLGVSVCLTFFFHFINFEP